MSRRRRIRLWETTSNRGANFCELAIYLGMSESHLNELMPELLEGGFPQRDSILRTYDIKAVDLWLDRRHGLATQLGALGVNNDHGERIQQWRDSA